MSDQPNTQDSHPAAQNDRDAAPYQGRGRGRERGRGGRGRGGGRGGYGDDGPTGTAPATGDDRFASLADRAGDSRGPPRPNRRDDRGPRPDRDDAQREPRRYNPDHDERAPRSDRQGPRRDDNDGDRPPRQDRPREGDVRRDDGRGGNRRFDDDGERRGPRTDRPPRRFDNGDDDRRPAARNDQDRRPQRTDRNYDQDADGNRPFRNERAPRRSENDNQDDRPVRHERPPRRNNAAERDGDNERPVRNEPAPRRAQDDYEADRDRPVRNERPPRRGDVDRDNYEAERPARNERPPRRNDAADREAQDDERPAENERPARRNDAERPIRNERPVRRDAEQDDRPRRNDNEERRPVRNDAPARRDDEQRNDDGDDDREDYRRARASRPQQGGRGRGRATRAMRSASQDKEIEAMFEVRHKQTGINFDKYEKIAAEVVPKDIPPATSFDDFQVHDLLKANLERCGYVNPTPVQKYGIPVTFHGKDIMACAQTGSGKTAAFLIPIVDHVLRKGVSLPYRRCIYPIAVIMAPTRELAAQIFDEARKLTYKTDVVPMCVYGGTDYASQFAGVENGADIIVATPGRLKDLFDRHRVSFERVRFLVLDEADRMLDMGFDEQIDYLVAGDTTDMPDCDVRQTLLYSATFPKAIQNLAKSYLKRDHYLLTVGRVGSTTTNITQRIVWCDDREKRTMMMKILCTLLQTDLVLIFVEKKASADSLFEFLNRENIPCASIHGDRKQWEREAALASFKSGETPVLVATDVAARGLDIPHVAHVIQYDLPSSMDDYIHRIGRTGRAGNCGTATGFFSDNNRPIAAELLAYLSEHEQDVPDWLEAAAVDSLSNASRRPGGRRGGRGGAAPLTSGGPPTRASGPPSSAPPNLKSSDAPLAEDWEALMMSEMGGGGGKKNARKANASAGGANDGGF